MRGNQEKSAILEDVRELINKVLSMGVYGLKLSFKAFIFNK
jgi:hypothetical protein